MGKEYIDREAIKYEQWAVGPLNAPLMVVRKKTIESLPAADVVEVVRCRECKYYRIHRASWGEDIPHCIKAWGGAEVDPMDFCSCGERKAGE